MNAKAWLELAEIAAGIVGVPLAGAALDGAQKLLEYIERQKAIGLRTGKWSKADRAKVNERWAELEQSHAWQTDAEGGN